VLTGGAAPEVVPAHDEVAVGDVRSELRAEVVERVLAEFRRIAGDGTATG